MDESTVHELLRLKNGNLYHRESQELEFKEQFNYAALADYYRDFAAFAKLPPHKKMLLLLSGAASATSWIGAALIGFLWL